MVEDHAERERGAWAGPDRWIRSGPCCHSAAGSVIWNRRPRGRR